MVTNSDGIKTYYRDIVILKSGTSTGEGGQINQRREKTKERRSGG